MRRELPPGKRLVLILLALSLPVLAVYWQVGGHPFVNYDDPLYIYANPHVLRGLTWEGVSFAFTSDMDAGWIPLTWLSRMADVSLFGMDAGKHHLGNVLFHLLNTQLLFLVLRRMTGKDWESAAVAALFGVHPLHVESVAWVVERKDMLAGFFWMLSLGAYARYAANPCVSRYLAVVSCFFLGLMSKPTVVTLPFVLLLLDWWPLRRLWPPGSFSGEGGAPGNRASPHTAGGPGKESSPGEGGAPPAFRPASAGRLVLEKLPLVALSAAVSAVIFLAHRNIGSMSSLEAVPLWARAGNALVSYGSYLRKTVWPSDLAVFYPHPGTGLVPWKAALSALFLCAVTATVLVHAKRRRFLATGWLWYLGTLVPVIGLVQAGDQAMADRYTYLPLIGVFLLAAWGVSGFAEGRPVVRTALKAVVPAVVLCLAAASFVQAGHWRDSVALYTRSLAVTEKNWRLWNNLGQAHADLGRNEEAIASYREALRIRPGTAGILNNLGLSSIHLGRYAEGIAFCGEALAINPRYADAWFNSGIGFEKLGRIPQAIEAYRESVRLDPGHADAWNNLGAVYGKLGQNVQAAVYFRQALRIRPDHALAAKNLNAVSR